MFPQFSGLGGCETGAAWPFRKESSVPKPYPPEFRRRALDLVASGGAVRDVAEGWG